MNIANHAQSDFDPSVNQARQALYRFAALTLADPQSGTWERLHRLRRDPLPRRAAALVRSLPAARPEDLGLGELPLEWLDPRPVLNLLPASASELNSQYEATFGLLVSSNCPPYETEYINSKFAFQRSNGLADISGFYNAFGLTVSQHQRERPDHIRLELEFMAVLLELERQASESQSSVRRERQEICRSAQSRFLQQHLAWWAPTFARLLCCQNSGGSYAGDQQVIEAGRERSLPHEHGPGFYTAAGMFLAALIPAERALFGLPPASRPVGPTTLERPEECEGCQLAG